MDRAASYYTASLGADSDYPVLAGEVRADVAVIGGGFTGVATAVELAERGLSVALLESRRIGWGASGRNGGQVTGSLSGDEAMRRQLRARAGVDADEFIWNLRWRGHEIIRRRVARYGIDCDLQRGHLHAALKPAHVLALRAHLQQAERRGMGAEVTLLDAAGVREHLATGIYLAALKNLRNFHLHPLKLCLGEARAAADLGVRIFERSEVTGIVHGPQPQVVTPRGRVIARQVLIAGDVYHRLERGRLSGMIFPAMGGIVATRPLGELGAALNPQRLAVYDCRFVLDYYRPTADGRLLFGGGADYSGRESRDVAAQLRPAIEGTFPQLTGVDIEFQWTCAMGIVVNRIPQLGRLSPTVWYAQGYSGHGIAASHIVGEIMAEALTGQLSKFDTFAAFRHIRVPYGELLGNPLLAAGMWYYNLRERLK
ncbi:MAG TPA: FAD-binding oxidoreductase [Steroidobacteraceae bacterium]|nr:FAD-binding oxidoreductase [Steroidobacteraceae bacterium]